MIEHFTSHFVSRIYSCKFTPPFPAADIAELQQALHLLAELLRHSGVGALPLSPPPPDVPSLPSEDEEPKIAEMTAAVQALFETRKRLEESAGMVVSLLAAEKDGRR